MLLAVVLEEEEVVVVRCLGMERFGAEGETSTVVTRLIPVGVGA